MMATPPLAALWFLPFVVPIAFWVALSDLRTMKIPNRAVLALVGVFLLVGPFVLPLPDWGWRWVNLAVVLAAGFVLSSLGMVGAGDAKFAAAMAPFVAVGDFRLMLLLLVGILPAAYVTHRIFGRIPTFRRATEHWKSWHSGKKFPMGFPLAGALVAYLGLAAAL